MSHGAGTRIGGKPADIVEEHRIGQVDFCCREEHPCPRCETAHDYHAAYCGAARQVGGGARAKRFACSSADDSARCDGWAVGAARAEVMLGGTGGEATIRGGGQRPL